MGWNLNDWRLHPILMTFDPIPESCLEMIYRNNTKVCTTLRCAWKFAQLPCNDLCKCDKFGTILCINGLRIPLRTFGLEKEYMMQK